MKILVVESGQTINSLLRGSHLSHHYRVDTATVERAEQQPRWSGSILQRTVADYDLVVLDAATLQPNGISLCQQLRAGGAQIPILLLIDAVAEAQSTVVLEAGADDYVTKPFDAEELLARVEILLHRHRRDPLQQQAQMYQALVENSPDIIERFDTDFRHLYVSPKLEAVTGVSAEQFIGKTCRELGLPVDMVNLWEATAQHLLRTGQAQTIEFEVPAALGSRQFEMRLAPELTQENVIESILCISRDVTVRKQSELALREQEAMVQRLADNIPGVIHQYLLHPDGSDEFLYVSAGCRNIWELSPEASARDISQVWAMIHPEDAAQLKQAVHQAAQQLEVIRIEFRMLPPSGGVRWVKSIAQPERLPNGDVLFNGFIWDVSDHKQAVLQRQEMSTALSNAVEGISQLNPQGRYVFVNDAYAQMVGYTAAEIVGSDWQSTVHPDDHERAIAAYQQMLHQEKVELEVRGSRKDGSVFDKSLVMVSAYDEQRQFTGHYCFMKDVSDRKHSALQLQRQLARERLLAEITDAVRQTLDLDQILTAAAEQVRHFLQTDRVIVFRLQPDWQGVVEAESVAPGWVKTLGMNILDSCFNAQYMATYRQGRITSIADVETTEVDACYVNLLKNLQVRANLVVPIVQEDQLWGFLIAHHCRGARQWVPESTQLLQQVATQLGIAIQQADLYRQTREQAALIDIATDAIFVRDLTGKIVFWSEGATRLYGWRKNEAFGKVARQLLKKRGGPDFDQALNTTLSQGFWQGELTQSTKAGKEILVASRWTLVRDRSGRPQSLLEVNTDITEKKRLEEQFYQAQRLESLGRLASGVAHDLANILTPILGIAQLFRLRFTEADPATQNQLDILETSARRGTEMVRQIMTFAQGNATSEAVVDIGAVLQEVIAIICQAFPSSIEIHSDMPPSEGSNELSKEVLADSTHLHQIFMNLCINARDAMPDGGRLTIVIENDLIDEASARKNLDTPAGQYVVVT
ncbi:MAG: PAS domain S-box protein, partial [Phormidesmis sp.]